MTTTDTELQFEWLDLDELIAHSRNPRDDLGDLTELADSIGSVGLLEPLVVVPTREPDRYEILAGHRRAAAAQQAGVTSVPCVIRPDLAADDDDRKGQARHIGTMVAENQLRANLTSTEEARAVQQMLDLGMKAGDVVKATGLDRKRVIKGAATARLDDESLRLISEYDLDLDMAAAVSEFAGDGEEIGALIMAGTEGKGRFAHALEAAKRRKKGKVETEKVRGELAEAGVPIVDEVNYGSGVKNRAIDYLLEKPVTNPADKVSLTPENHAGCPGHAAHVRVDRYDGTPDVTFVCTDPGTYGHGERYAMSSSSSAVKVPASELPEEEREAKRQERAEVIANNKAMDAANEVRRQWLADFLRGRPTAAVGKQLTRFSIEALGEHATVLSDWWGWGSSLTKLEETPLREVIVRPYGSSYGVKPRQTLTSGEKVADPRLPVQLFAHIVGAFEQSIARDSWRAGHSHHAAWLRFLEGLGYELADVEHNLIGIAEAKEEVA